MSLIFCIKLQYLQSLKLMQISSWESSCIEVFRPKETQNEVSEVSGKVTGWNLSEFLHDVIAAYKPKKTL